MPKKTPKNLDCYAEGEEVEEAVAKEAFSDHTARGRLIVHVISGNNLQDEKHESKTNAHVSVEWFADSPKKVAKKKVLKTDAVKKSVNPKWNEKLVFGVYPKLFTERGLNGIRISVSSGHHPLGEVVFKGLDDFLNDLSTERELQLEHAKKSKKDEAAPGTLRVRVSFVQSGRPGSTSTAGGEDGEDAADIKDEDKEEGEQDKETKAEEAKEEGGDASEAEEKGESSDGGQEEEMEKDLDRVASQEVLE